VQAMSIGLLVEQDTPMIWRGPMATSALTQLLNDTRWDDLDYLFIDLPPGTGDIQLTLAQKIPVAGAIVVTTPSEVASDVVQKSVTYARDLGITVLGIVENMNRYRCPSCGVEHDLFEGDTEAMCAALNVPLLGRIPFDRTLARTFDKGQPLLDETYPTIQRYHEIAERIQKILDYKKVLAEKL